MAADNNKLTIVNFIISILILGVAGYVILGHGGGSESIDIERAKSLAGELSDNNLHASAIEEYKIVLASSNIDEKTRGNINFLIGKIYYEELKDYENGAAYFVRARSLYPEGSFYESAGKNLIACYEKMGRVIDAKRELDKTVNIDSVYSAHENGILVAKIGEIPIFMDQINDLIQTFPTEIQKEYTSKDKKLEAINQYIQMELIYKAAERENLRQDPEIQKTADEIIRQVLIDKYIRDNVLPPDQVDSVDVHNYYLAHKDDRYSGRSFSDAQNEVIRDYAQDKFRNVLAEHVSRLAITENVRVFEENIK